MPRTGKPTSSAAPAWLLRCAPGLAKTLVTELRFNALIDRRTKPTLLWQQVYFTLRKSVYRN